MSPEDERPDVMFLNPEEDDEHGLDADYGLDFGDDDDDGGDDAQSARSAAEPGQAEGGPVDVYAALSKYHASQPHEREQVWNSFSEDERAALALEGEPAPFAWDPASFTVPDSDGYSEVQLKRAEQEARLGLDAIVRGVVPVTEGTWEVALDLGEDVHRRLEGRARDEAVLRLANLVSTARLHAQSAGTFDDSNVIARKAWRDQGGRHHELLEDHRGRKREEVMSRRETEEAITASRAARTEREHFRVSGDASPELVDFLKRLETGGTIDLADYASLPKMDRVAVQQKLTKDQKAVLRRQAEYAEERG